MSKHDSRLDKLEKDQASKAPTEQKIPRNPVEFAKLLKIDPDPWQRDLLTSKEKRIILNCARQSGKSTIVAIRALHHALTNRGSLVLILSPTQRQSGLLFEKIVTSHNAWQTRRQRRRLSHHVATQKPEPHRIAPWIRTDHQGL
jgi:phage terminase large subunit-like protein